MLGYRGHATWRDMSEYVVHFPRHEVAGGKSGYDTVLSILSDRQVMPSGPFGAARRLNALGDTQKAACFSEVPLDRLDRLVERRSKYGVAFRQEFLTQRGGARVWYVENDGAVAQSIREMVTARAVPGMDVDDTFWKMTPFFDFPSEAYDYQFEWEREWRVPGGLTFQPADVAFLFIPENLHSAARAFFDDHEAEGTGPSYKCPYLDPLWPDERLQAVFAGAEL